MNYGKRGQRQVAPGSPMSPPFLPCESAVEESCRCEMPQERFNRAGVEPQTVSIGLVLEVGAVDFTTKPGGWAKPIYIEKLEFARVSQTVANPVGAELPVKNREALFGGRNSLSTDLREENDRHADRME